VLRSDDAPLRLLFGGLVAVAALVLALDYQELGAHVARLSIAPDLSKTTLVPLKPSRPSETLNEPLFPPDPNRPPPMKFDLMPEGRLMAFGTIMPGTAQDFTAELAKRGSYVKTVVFNSPGGSVRDALQIGRLIRQHKYDTEVEDGQICVSSCPLAFSGGIERRVSAGAKIGVHQVTPVPQPGVTAASAVDATQRVLAECEHHLRAMGVDLTVWTYAKETPRDKLRYFDTDELMSLRLTTRRGLKDRTAKAGPAKP
jgi:hypothetical protein